ncbi:uncharacterized protein LOC108741036 [Agrilus planipennis]|uniref:Uncharacterized protein LOC108741036 n=1 Tax=Agrilus planipennis TaxID=224129 RepID=A0A1W4XFK3_AGRPL|nr:uncharacterized protein LOC108741036 [Agrilus planipennis]
MLLSAFLTLLLCQKAVLALKCYRCIYAVNYNDWDISCLPNHFDELFEQDNLVECHPGERCSILRIENYKDTYANRPLVFARGCWSNSMLENVEFSTSSKGINYYQHSCLTDKCNIGNGYETAESHNAEEIEWTYGGGKSLIKPHSVLLEIVVLVLINYKVFAC